MELRSSVLKLAAILVIFEIAEGIDLFLNEWTMKITGGKIEADTFAMENGFVNLGEIIPGSDLYHMKYPRRLKRALVSDGFILNKIKSHKEVVFAEQLVEKVRVKRDKHDLPTRSVRLNDPYWEKMWYLNRGSDLDMNVEQAWEEGVTGKGVTVTILDDGIERDHPDLVQNYDPLSSIDINDNDNDPRPRYDFSNSNGHGTRCAGQVAASSNNSLCAVGIAFNAKIGGIRMLDGHVNDAVEARSLSFNPNHVDIYSSSWGPNDDGKTVDGPGQLAEKALLEGVAKGRKGKGSIFVWASGNGGRYKDNCNCDGYATSIYTVTVSSTTESGHVPWYSEACSSTLATTYSSGATSERQVVTTDLHHTCTAKHTGTSASAPMAAGIIALTLEANPDLTWRDVQHIIVRTARPAHLQTNDWRVNSLGRKVSHSYGFGLMDATAMVRLAKRWKPVPEQKNCSVASPYFYKMIPAMSSITLELTVDQDCPVKYLEQVVVPIHVATGRKRGDFRIYLTSPSGTRSTLLDNRPRDFSTSGFIDWPFMSVHSWGEDPRGTWTLEVFNDASAHWGFEAKFYTWSLQIYGTESDPILDTKLDETNLDSANQNSKRNSNEKVGNSAKGQNIATPNKRILGIGKIQPSLSSAAFNETVSCLTRSGECSSDVSLCRTFSQDSVSRIFCRCSKDCLEIGTLSNSSLYMKCEAEDELKQAKDVPAYCKFMSFI